MKKFYVIALLATMTMAAMSCDKNNPRPRPNPDPDPYGNEITIKAGYAAALYYGKQEAANCDLYTLIVSDGNLDQDFNLSTKGYAFHLNVGVKCASEMDVIYKGNYDVDYYLAQGNVESGEMSPSGFTGSYVEYKTSDKSSSGYILIKEDMDGKLSVTNNGFEFTFTDGDDKYVLSCAKAIEYIDCTGGGGGGDDPVFDKVMNAAQAEYYGEYYAGVNNYYFDMFKYTDVNEDGYLVGPYTWIQYDWNTKLDATNWDSFPIGKYSCVAYNDENNYPASSFVDGGYDDSGEILPTYVEVYDGVSEYSYSYPVTAGYANVNKKSSNYTINAKLTVEGYGENDFSFEGEIDFMDGSSTAGVSATKSALGKRTIKVPNKLRQGTFKRPEHVKRIKMRSNSR